MDIAEAMKALKEGKKVRRKFWKPDFYYYLDKNGMLIDSNNQLAIIPIDFIAVNAKDWEIYKEPILDKEEKKYLESFLRPYTKRFDKITITKARFCSGDFAIRIGFFAFKDDNDITDSLSLPFFSKNEHMYEGMKLDKCYTLEELGLFEEERK